ncbi:MAG: FkbM family methyltransferase [Woeseiaceae bacterium]|nr:FkbM family methyltransferase [Woeseiaceae bacterium]
MAIASWKRFEKGPWMQRNKTRLRQFLGTEIRLQPSISIDTVKDADWCYDAAALGSDSVIYSMGIGDTIEFDLALIERTGATVHAFDPTPGTYETLATNELPEEFRFHPWAVAGDDGTLSLYPRVRKNGSLSDMMYTLVPDPASAGSAIHVPAYTVGSIAKQLDHTTIDLLKMDIEGAEYDVINGILAGKHRPRQILVEFHHRHADIDRALTENAVAAMQAAGYQIFYVSENVREVSFLFLPDRCRA